MLQHGYEPGKNTKLQLLHKVHRPLMNTPTDNQAPRPHRRRLTATNKVAIVALTATSIPILPLTIPKVRMQQRMLAIPRFAITGVKTYESTCCMGMCYPPEKNITLITKEMRASYRPNRCAYVD